MKCRKESLFIMCFYYSNIVHFFILFLIELSFLHFLAETNRIECDIKDYKILLPIIHRLAPVIL